MVKTSVFLVEDQPALLKNLVKALGTFPELDVVGTAQDGERAIEDIVRLKPRIVLLDLELPGIHGIEVTRRLKRRVPEVEILILTSFDDEQKVYEAIQAGASGYLVKRVGPDKIRSGIQEVLEGGTVLEPIIARRFWSYFQSVQARPATPPTTSPRGDNPWGLTPLEFDVLTFVAKGLSNPEVGQALTLERRTVRTHLAKIYKKLGVNSHVDAVVKALKAGIIEI
jgi:DNA-binding NarL/FixJ family response regulator